MRIYITTAVKQPYREVAQKFDQTLFKALSPPFPKVQLLRYDGNQPGDEVHLRINFLFFSQTWKSRITENESRPGEMHFVDEGLQLPFFLRYWRHRHVIRQHGTGSLIIDDITFRGPGLLLSLLVYPVMYLQFVYRKPVYRRYFGNLAGIILAAFCL
jgi:ligand-binding SRPBCC domain-containing protein